MKKKVVPYLLLAPMILIMGALVFYPVAATFSYSLKKWKLTQPGDIRVIGFKNYVDILTSDSFWYSLQNTLVILAVVVALTTVVGFLVSSFLNIQVRLSGVLLALAVLPWALPPFVNGIEQAAGGTGAFRSAGGISDQPVEPPSGGLGGGSVAQRALYGTGVPGRKAVHPRGFL